MENFRRSIGVRMKETKDVWEGEVVELKTEESEDPHAAGQKIVNSVIVTLKTSKGSKQLKLDPSIYENMTKEKVIRNSLLVFESFADVIIL